MRKTLTTTEIAMDLRDDENANWSMAGCYALAEYFEEIEEETGQEIEFDRVAIRCEYAEFNSLEDWAKEYQGTEYLIEACEAMGVDEKIATGDDAEAIEDEIREYIRDRGTLIEFEGGIIVSSF